jgi:hypothetical protein
MSASIRNAAYSIDLVENDNAAAVRIVPLRDKEIPKNRVRVKSDFGRARLRRLRGNPEAARSPPGGCPDRVQNSPIYFGLQKKSHDRRFRGFAACEILL